MPFGYNLRSRVTPYIILFIERDGSTYLTSLLMTHPEVAAVYEQFAVLRQKGSTGKEQLDWARDFYTPPLIGRHSAIGFKTKLVDVLDLDGFTKLLKQRQCYVIQMHRKNHVKAVVSRINAKRLHDSTGLWNLYKESDRLPPAEIDFETFDQYLKERMEADKQLGEYVQSLNLPTYKMIYEELLVNKDALLTELFKFLRVKPMLLEGKTLKHTKDNLREVVLNFGELRSRYVGTPYEAMFDEVLVTD